jgi:hypothetical protein
MPVAAHAMCPVVVMTMMPVFMMTMIMVSICVNAVVQAARAGNIAASERGIDIAVDALPLRGVEIAEVAAGSSPRHGGHFAAHAVGGVPIAFATNR